MSNSEVTSAKPLHAQRLVHAAMAWEQYTTPCSYINIGLN